MSYSDTTVVIPVKDEPATEKVVGDVLKVLPNCHVIVIHKGLLNIKIRDKNLVIIKQTSSGKGRACAEAVRYVKTQIMCLIDGDDTYEAKDLRKLVQLVRDGADMALGNRMERISEKTMPKYVQFGNDVLTGTANLLYGMRIKDSQTGLRAIRTSVFRSLHLRQPRFGIESEMNIKCRKHRYKVAEIPTRYHVRVGTSKQFKLLDGLKLLLINFTLLLEQ